MTSPNTDTSQAYYVNMEGSEDREDNSNIVLQEFVQVREWPPYLSLSNIILYIINSTNYMFTNLQKQRTQTDSIFPVITKYRSSDMKHGLLK